MFTRDFFIAFLSWSMADRQQSLKTHSFTRSLHTLASLSCPPICHPLPEESISAFTKRQWKRWHSKLFIVELFPYVSMFFSVALRPKTSGWAAPWFPCLDSLQSKCQGGHRSHPFPSAHPCPMAHSSQPLEPLQPLGRTWFSGFFLAELGLNQINTRKPHETMGIHWYLHVFAIWSILATIRVIIQLAANWVQVKF